MTTMDMAALNEYARERQRLDRWRREHHIAELAEVQHYAAEQAAAIAARIQEWEAWAARIDEVLRSTPITYALHGSVPFKDKAGDVGCVRVVTACDEDKVRDWLTSALGHADSMVTGLRRAAAMAAQQQQEALDRITAAKTKKTTG